ncbi:putative WRKY transcription factor 2 [Acorus calamus]|uniref:WRKY transcription factor 2 n=1 Tax=Acorus calamus TaxID=4465 RepID=A0AAV9CXA2_ACOCL|nr:putative WRKY transcription factor 2 [Acorus calamus]
MAGVDGDWTTVNQSPRTWLSCFINEDFPTKSFSGHNGIDGDEKPNTADDEEMVLSGNGDPQPENGFSDLGQKPSSSLSERIASRAGFNSLRLNTAKVRSVDLMSPDIKSHFFTIPPGLSPTAFLDSPVFLSNSMVQPSPTTGKFMFPLVKNKDHIIEDADAESSFAFKPHLESNSSYNKNEVDSAVDQPQSAPSMEVSVRLENPIQSNNLESNGFPSQTQQGFHLQPSFPEPCDTKDLVGNVNFNPQSSDSIMSNENSPPPDDQPDGEGGDRRGDFSSAAVGAPAEDGYNWRKYGQKQVKGSEFPRSYYKCTHPTCPVKKKVERSHEGHITEIIYKGAHNHPKPPPNRRSGFGSCQQISDMQYDGTEQHDSQDKSLWGASQGGGVIGNGQPDWRLDCGLDAAAPSAAAASVGLEYGVLATSMQTQDGPQFEAHDAIDVSSTLSNDEDEDDQRTLGSMSMGCDADGDGDESESKRRKLEACAMEMNAASRALREPRVVVQTTSEVDILDDGYRWRKYGQKVVKGNPNPRSYYKCTNPGCTVRKHVERASHDLKSVITTYEGKHNHDVPAARNSSSSHANSGAPSSTASAASGPTHIHRRPEPSQVQDAMGRFDAPPLPPFARPFPFGMGQPGLVNMSMVGLGAMQMKMPVMGVHSYLRPQHQVDGGGFVMPKGEPKEEPMVESGGLSMPNSAASVYHQMMGRFPLEHQL